MFFQLPIKFGGERLAYIGVKWNADFCRL